MKEGVSNTSMSGAIIVGASLGYYAKIVNESNWLVIGLLGIIVFIIGLTNWGGGK
jgi:hypothetical protein